MGESAGTPEREYIWLPLDGQAWALPLALITDAGTAAPRIHYIHTDHLGTPQAMTSSGLAQVEWSATFRPFGEADAITGSESLDLRFPGQLYDAETGYHQNFWRDYDSTLGRYLQSDPIGLAGGLNTYGYARQNPANLIDPTGTVPALVPAIVACMMEPLCAVPLIGAAAYASQKLGELCEAIDPLDRFLNESTEHRNPAQDKRLSPGEIRALKGAGIDPEELKGGKRTGSQDLYKDKKGNIYVKPKGGKRAGEPTGLNINDYL